MLIQRRVSYLPSAALGSIDACQHRACRIQWTYYHRWFVRLSSRYRQLYILIVSIVFTQTKIIRPASAHLGRCHETILKIGILIRVYRHAHSGIARIFYHAAGNKRPCSGKLSSCSIAVRKVRARCYLKWFRSIPFYFMFLGDLVLFSQ